MIPWRLESDDVIIACQFQLYSSVKAAVCNFTFIYSCGSLWVCSRWVGGR